MTPRYAREWMQNRRYSRPQKRALLNTYPKQIRHGFFNAKQSFSMQKGPPKPTDMAAKGHKPRGMHLRPISRNKRTTLQGMKGMMNASIQAWIRD